MNPITDYMDMCVICGNPAQAKHHLIMGTANRSKSEKWKLYIPLCNACHNMTDNSVHLNSKLTAFSRIIGQLGFELQMIEQGMSHEEARNKFRKEFNKSNL